MATPPPRASSGPSPSASPTPCSKWPPMCSSATTDIESHDAVARGSSAPTSRASSVPSTTPRAGPSPTCPRRRWSAVSGVKAWRRSSTTWSSSRTRSRHETSRPPARCGRSRTSNQGNRRRRWRSRDTGSRCHGDGILELKAVSKSYGAIKVVDDLSVSLQSGGGAGGRRSERRGQDHHAEPDHRGGAP